MTVSVFSKDITDDSYSCFGHWTFFAMDDAEKLGALENSPQKDPLVRKHRRSNVTLIESEKAVSATPISTRAWVINTRATYVLLIRPTDFKDDAYLYMRGFDKIKVCPERSLSINVLLLAGNYLAGQDYTLVNVNSYIGELPILNYIPHSKVELKLVSKLDKSNSLLSVLLSIKEGFKLEHDQTYHEFFNETLK
ncbi:MAG: hypothetical protein Q8S21_03670 [Candidatus Paracaedibacteraceae bacterium]|nr:hypothetical protein [Candidatus Paracaedibacteraceae bacterium]